MNEGRNHAEMIPRVITETARHEVEARPVASMGRVRSVDHGDQRCTIELLSDTDAQSDNVPICVPFADDGAGDVLPVDAGTKGIVLFLDHPVGPQLSGGEQTGEIGMDIEDAVFLPAGFWSDEDDVPSHDSTERVWEHPSGSRISMRDDGRVQLRTPNGARFLVESQSGTDVDYGDIFPEGYKSDAMPDDDTLTESEEAAYDPTTDNTTWPIGNDGETAARIDHPDGPHVSATQRGVALGAEDDGDVREVVSGTPTDGDRSELDGHHQHFHVVDHDDGEFSLAGPQLSFREFIAWMTDSTRQSSLRNAGAYADARTYAENYLAWLEAEIGRSIDPTNPDDWPDTEPMPTPAEREEFEP